MERELRDLAREVLSIQDAVNLSGLVIAWEKSLGDLRRLLANASTFSINTHPINTLWIDKLAQLNGIQCPGLETIGEAYDQVRKIAEM